MDRNRRERMFSFYADCRTDEIRPSDHETCLDATAKKFGVSVAKAEAELAAAFDAITPVNSSAGMS